MMTIKRKGKWNNINISIYQHILETKFQSTVIKIPKGSKNLGLEKYFQDNSQKEYQYLTKIIDFNDIYQSRLDKENKFCRYSEVRTYKDNKVEINSDNGYINASWIHIPYHKSFIATQGPLESTIEDFWVMCYTYNVKVIVMLCKLDEDYKEKCANYWDTNMKNFKVEKINDTINLTHDTKIRKFKICNLNQDLGIGDGEKIIYQIHFTCWPDHSIPENSYNEIINIIKIVDKFKDDKPVVVHCSAGIGRTGTFISVYNLYHEILEQINNKNKNEIIFSIMNLVRKLKEMRLYSVENQTQYNFLYQFVNLVLIKNNTFNE